MQYGYRFMLDYTRFLTILILMGFDDNQSQKARAVQIVPIAAWLASGSWGRYWGDKLGW